MAKPKDPETFEVTKYEGLEGDNDETANVVSMINQVVADKAREMPTWGINVKFEGDRLRLTCHCYEMDLPHRIKFVEDMATKYLSEMVKHIKKEVKSRFSKSVDLKQIKDTEGYSVEKVSLNNRYYYIRWSLYEIK